MLGSDWDDFCLWGYTNYCRTELLDYDPKNAMEAIQAKLNDESNLSEEVTIASEC